MKASTVIEYESIEITTIMINTAKEHTKVGSGSATVTVYTKDGDAVVEPTIRVTFNQASK